MQQPSHKKIPLLIEANFYLLAEPFTEKQAAQQTERCLRCNHSIEIDRRECILCMRYVDVGAEKCLAINADNSRLIEDRDELRDAQTGTAVVLRDELCIRCGMVIKACPQTVVCYRRFSAGIF